MLNEGIHAPDVGAVLLFRPTESPRIFYQQIGRCLQVGTDAEPIIFDFVNNFQSIRAGDFLNDLNEAGEKERELRDQFGLSADYLPKIHVHDECLEILETFRKIDERLGSWEIQFQELVSYREEHGDCLVPRNLKNKQLLMWVDNQRANKKKGILERGRVKRLDELGFSWDPQEEYWEQHFQELVAYKEKHGNCSVPSNWKSKGISGWVRRQRANKKKGILDRERVKRLDELGFSWDPQEEFWEQRFQELVAYKEKYGNCLVPDQWKNNKQLATWVNNQRVNKKKGILDRERVKRLDELGFSWDQKEEFWEQRFQELVDYKEKHGDCSVPRKWENKQLSTWVHSQRENKKKGVLDRERVKRLDELGFSWDQKEEFWEQRFQELVAYKKSMAIAWFPENGKTNSSPRGLSHSELRRTSSMTTKSND